MVESLLCGVRGPRFNPWPGIHFFGRLMSAAIADDAELAEFTASKTIFS